MRFIFESTYHLSTNLLVIFWSIIIILGGVSCFLSKKNFKEETRKYDCKTDWISSIYFGI